METNDLRRKIEWAVILAAIVVILASVILPMFMYKELKVEPNKVKSYNVPINAEVTMQDGKTSMKVSTSPKISEEEMKRIQAAVAAQMEKDYRKKMELLERERRLRAKEECDSCKDHGSASAPPVPTNCESVDCHQNPERCAALLGIQKGDL